MKYVIAAVTCVALVAVVSLFDTEVGAGVYPDAEYRITIVNSAGEVLSGVYATIEMNGMTNDRQAMLLSTSPHDRDSAGDSKMIVVKHISRGVEYTTRSKRLFWKYRINHTIDTNVKLVLHSARKSVAVNYHDMTYQSIATHQLSKIHNDDFAQVQDRANLANTMLQVFTYAVIIDD